MSKRLKKAMALIASLILWVVNGFPDRVLAGSSEILNTATAHPYKAIGWVIATALAVYALWDWILDVLGIHTKKRLENEIRTWLDSFSFAVQRVIDPDSYFNFSVTPENIPTFTVALTKQLDRYVMIGTRVRLRDEDKLIVDNMSRGDQEGFKAHLGIILTRGRTTFRLDLPNNELMIQNRVPVTADLTEHVFMTAVDELITARAAAMNGLVLLVGLARTNAAKAAEPPPVVLPVPPQIEGAAE
jgi:hypothetical protein